MAVAGLRVARAAMLLVPLRVLLRHQANLAVGFGEGTVGPTGVSQLGDEELGGRADEPVDRRCAKAREGHDEAVEFARPVKHAVVAGVGDQHVQATAAVGEVTRAGGVLHVGGVVGSVVQTAVRVEVVVQLVVVVAQAAEQAVVAGAAEECVVAQVTEDLVLAVFDQHAALEGFEVEQKVGHLQHRLVGVVEVELARDSVVLERCRRGGAHVVVERCQRFGARQRVVAGAAVDEVVAQATVDGVVTALFPGQQVDGLLQVAVQVDPGAGEGAWQFDQAFGADTDAIQRLGQAVAAGADAAVVADQAVFAAAAKEAVAAGAAVEVVVPAVAVQHVGATAAVHDVVAVFGLDEVIAADAHAVVAGRVVQQVEGAHDDALSAACLGALRGCGVAADVDRVVVDEGQRPAVAALDAQDHGVVAGDDVGIEGVFGDQADARVAAGAECVAVDACAGTAEEDVAAIRAQLGRRQAIQAGTAADDVVLAQVAEDHVVAAAAFDVVVAVACHVLEGWQHDECAAAADAGTGHRAEDAAVALDDVVAELAEDLVVLRATCNGVVAPDADVAIWGLSLDRGAVVEDADAVFAVHRDRRGGRAGQHAVGVGKERPALRVHRHRQRLAFGGAEDFAVQRAASQAPEAHVEVVGAEVDVGVVAGDHVVAGAAVEAVVVVERTDDVAAADEDVVAVAAEHRVAALLAQDEVAAVIAMDQVIAAAHVGGGVQRCIGQRALAGQQQFGRDGRQAQRRDEVATRPHGQALVAEDQVGPCTGVDLVARTAAHQHVVAAAGVDEVGAVVDLQERDGLDALHGELMHRKRRECRGGLIGRARGDAAVVAEDDVVAVAAVDDIGASAAQHDVLAGAGGDAVVTAQPRGQGDGPDAVDVVAAHRVQRVQLQQFLGQVVDEAVVAEDDVAAVQRRRAAAAGKAVDGVVAATADNDVAADAGGEGVVAVAELVGHAVERAPVDGRDQAQHLHLVVVVGRVAHRAGARLVDTNVDAEDAAVVAEDDVLAAAGIDDIAALPADDDVVAAVVGDGVTGAIAGFGVHAFQQIQSGQAGKASLDIAVVVGTQVAQVALVAEDDVGSGAAVEQVAAVAAEDAVTPGIAVHGIGRAVAGFGRADVLDEAGGQQLVAGAEAELADACIAGGIAEDGLATTCGGPVVVNPAAWHVLHHLAVIAEEDIGAAAAVDGVGAGQQAVTHRTDGQAADPGIGRHHPQCACDRIDVKARVAVDQVHATEAADVVVARAAGQVVAGTRADDRVVAGAAVDGDAEHGAFDTGNREQGAGVDDVVAGALEGVGAWEAEEVVCGAHLIEQLPAQHQVVFAARQVGAAAVPGAVLRGVAIDHQR